MAPLMWKVKPLLDVPSGGIWLGPGRTSAADGLWIGRLAEVVPGRTPKVWLGTSKEQVLSVVGKRGSGKSFTLGVIAEGFCLANDAPEVARQERRRAVLLFDPLDVYWTTRFPVSHSENAEANRHYQIAKAGGLVDLTVEMEAWVPGRRSSRRTDPAWFKVLRLPTGDLGLDEWELLLEVNVLTDPMGQALADALSLVRTHGYVKGHEKRPPKVAFDLDDLSSAIQSDELGDVYHKETLRALRQRIGSLSSTELFDASGTSIQDLIGPGRLSVILLARLPQAYRSAVVGILTRLLLDNRSAVAFAEKRLALDPTLTETERSELASVISGGTPRTVVALDEAQAFLAPGTDGPARRQFIRLVKEGRNHGLSVVLATQQPSAIDSRVLSQVETFISHQLVTEPDIRAVKENLKSATPEKIEFGSNSLDFSSLLRQLPAGYCLVSSSDMSTVIQRSIVVEVRPRATVHGGIEL